MSTHQRGVDRRGDAARVFKRVKVGVVEADELTAEEFGLLYLYYPEVLPDVEHEIRGDVGT